MRNIYLVQAQDTGPNSFLPLAVSYMWMFATTKSIVTENFQVADVLIEKKNTSKYVESMIDPDVVAMSSYVWNHEYNKKLAQDIKKKFPNALIVVGGPNIDKRDANFFDTHPHFDVAVLGEGELAFQEILVQRCTKQDYTNIPHVFPKGGKLCKLPSRLKYLDAVPSPILNGFYDWIIEKVEAEKGSCRWQVTYETLRGCPYQCAFCDLGEDYWNKVTKFDIERVLAEIDWMSDRKIEYVSVCDSNWGMLERDYDITAYVIQKKKQNGYPKYWDVTWAKAQPERLFRIAKLDRDTNAQIFKGVTFALQSLNIIAQEKSKRTNLKSEQVMHYLTKFLDNDIPTYSELIWPLPGETYDSLKQGVQNLVDVGQKSFLMIHPLVLTYNAPMGQQSYVEQEGLDTKEVLLDSYYLDADSMEDYVEEKTIAVIGTNHADRETVQKGNVFNYLFITLYYYGWAYYLLDYLQRTHNLRHVDVVEKMLTYFNDSSTLIGKEIQETQSALYDWFYNDAFWGRQVLGGSVYWDYKSATCVNFAENKKQLEQELVEFCSECLGIDCAEVVRLNLALCADYNTQYPFRINVDNTIAYNVLGINSTELSIDHNWPVEKDKIEFYRTAYQFQRKNSFWKCTATAM